jgi:hypothetical protein
MTPQQPNRGGVSPPGSTNRGFSSMDPERQRAEAHTPAHEKERTGGDRPPHEHGEPVQPHPPRR